MSRLKELPNGEWLHSCGWHVVVGDNYCGGCGQSLAGLFTTTVSTVTKSPATEGDWSCPKCGYINPREDGDCRICMTSKPL